MTADVENIVILGDDGIVPMAAVPDLTGYSNEATYARDVLTRAAPATKSPERSAPGTCSPTTRTAPRRAIDVRNAGHQLYVPDVSVGRLVETGQQILDQLLNFSTFEGQLDPGTLSLGETAAVTGYDFLTDGAAAGRRPPRRGSHRCGHHTDRRYVDRGRTTSRCSKNGGPDIVSPNAHYDYEALLPAAPASAAYYSDDELVFTGRSVVVEERRPIAAVHDGLSRGSQRLRRAARVRGAPTGPRSVRRAVTTSGSPTPPTATATTRSSPTPSGSPLCSPAR